MIDVSCIIVNYNTSDLTADAIKSIIDHTSANINFEVIVVDNASKFDDYCRLEKFVIDFAEVRIKLIRNRINTGFGSGNMLGVINSSPCRYYAFVNSDVLFLKQDTFYDLFNFMEANPEIGVCSPQMLGPDQSFRSTVDHFATPRRQLLKRSFLERLNPKRYPNRKLRYHEPIECDYIQGSFMFINSQSFDQVGGFDQNLFLYYEESDLSLRIKKECCQKTYLFPHQEYIHLQGKSTNKNILIKMEQKISLLYLIHKHHGIIWHRFMLLFYTVKYIFSSLLKPKNWALFKLLLQGAPLSKSLARKQIVLKK